MRKLLMAAILVAAVLAVADFTPAEGDELPVVCEWRHWVANVSVTSARARRAGRTSEERRAGHESARPRLKASGGRNAGFGRRFFTEALECSSTIPFGRAAKKRTREVASRESRAGKDTSGRLALDLRVKAGERRAGARTRQEIRTRRLRPRRTSWTTGRHLRHAPRVPCSARGCFR